MTSGRRPRRRGDVSAESALIMPVVMGVVLLVIHVAVTIHGAHVAEVVALRGAQTASRSVDRRTGHLDAIREMEATILELQGRPAESISLSIDRGRVRASVTLRPRGAVPWLTGTVTRVATVPLEVFMFSGER